MATAAEPLVVDRYALYDKIASGGMATVYFGRIVGAAGFTRTVAIKRLHPHLAEDTSFAAMMIDEARLAARIQHPNVVQTLDVVAVQGGFLIVMEYVAGESLHRLLRVHAQAERPAPLGIVSAVVTGMLHGLHAAHEAKSDRGEPLGIVHRDVSPQNVIVSIDGVARVIDFGVAKAGGRISSTAEGVVKGKLPYMAPEHVAGRSVTRLADIYAAGVVLWEALTARRLFHADDSMALMRKVLEGPPHAPSHFAPDVPPALDALVLRALARDPAARFATAREMADSLARIVPPALSTEVGEWVELAGKHGLLERAEKVATIEGGGSDVRSRPHEGAGPSAVASGGPGVLTVTRPGAPLMNVGPAGTWGPPPAPVSLEPDEMPTLGSQLSVETPVRRIPSPVRAVSARAWLALGGAVLIGAGIATAIVRPPSERATSAATSFSGAPTPVQTAPALVATVRPDPLATAPLPVRALDASTLITSATSPTPVTAAAARPPSTATAVRPLAPAAASPATTATGPTPKPPSPRPPKRSGPVTYVTPD